MTAFSLGELVHPTTEPLEAGRLSLAAAAPSMGPTAERVAMQVLHPVFYKVTARSRPGRAPMSGIL